jgi:hypothetical protein
MRMIGSRPMSPESPAPPPMACANAEEIDTSNSLL